MSAKVKVKVTYKSITRRFSIEKSFEELMLTSNKESLVEEIRSKSLETHGLPGGFYDIALENCGKNETQSSSKLQRDLNESTVEHFLANDDETLRLQVVPRSTFPAQNGTIGSLSEIKFSTLHSISSEDSEILDNLSVNAALGTSVSGADNSFVETSRLINESRLRKAKRKNKTQGTYLKFLGLAFILLIGLCVSLYMQQQSLYHSLELKEMELNNLKEAHQMAKRDYLALQVEYDTLTEHLVSLAEKEREAQAKDGSRGGLLSWVSNNVNNQWIQKQVNGFKETLSTVWKQVFDFYDRNTQKMSTNAKVLMLRLKNLTQFAQT